MTLSVYKVQGGSRYGHVFFLLVKYCQARLSHCQEIYVRNVESILLPSCNCNYFGKIMRRWRRAFENDGCKKKIWRLDAIRRDASQVYSPFNAESPLLCATNSQAYGWN